MVLAVGLRKEIFVLRKEISVGLWVWWVLIEEFGYGGYGVFAVGLRKEICHGFEHWAS